MDDGFDRIIGRLAATQHGIVTIHQAIRRGGSQPMIDQRRDSGRWERLAPGVFRIAGVADSWEQQLLTACRSGEGRAYASHRSAARLWELPVAEPVPVEVTVPFGRWHRLPGVVSHETVRPNHLDRTVRHGISVTTVVRTLIDLAAVTPVGRLEAALDDALRRELTDVASVQTRLEQLAARGRRGVRSLRALLAERDASTSASESVLETRFLRLLRERELPEPVPQFVIRTPAGRFIARTDFAYPDARLVIEVDSYLHHGGRRKFEDDLRRRTELVAAGWQVVHVTARQIQRGAPEICALIARTARRPA